MLLRDLDESRLLDLPRLGDVETERLDESPRLDALTGDFSIAAIFFLAGIFGVFSGNIKFYEKYFTKIVLKTK